MNLTPLMICCKEGHHRAAKALIQKGANVNLENVNHWTPLMIAVDGGHKAVVELLLTHDADVAFVGRYEYNVLHQAVYRGHAGVLRLLIGEGVERERLVGWHDVRWVDARGDRRVVPLLHAYLPTAQWHDRGSSRESRPA